MDHVLVTPRSLTEGPHPALLELSAAGFDLVCSAPGGLPGEAELIRLVRGCVGWIAGIEPVSPAVIEAATELRVISRNGIGVDNLPLELLRARGITVVVAEGANARGVAELTVGLMLAGLRRITQVDAGIKDGKWPRRKGLEIRDRTVGIVGCGAIGSEVARLVSCLGAHVVAYEPLQPDPPPVSERFTWVSFEALLTCADVVTLHRPSADGTPLINEDVLSRMRPGAMLINTSRASLVDESAILESLNSGRLGTYATDVHVQEPPASLALVGHPNVIATSHIGGYTRESVDRAAAIAVANLIDRLKS